MPTLGPERIPRPIGRHIPHGAMNHLPLLAQLRSLPKPCKLFLFVCILQALLAGAFSSVELSRTGLSNLQDLVLLLVSVVYFLGIVLDAFWRENGYQLLVGMASGTLSLVQVIVYASSLRAGRDTLSITVAAACAFLQVVSLALARWAYLGFGWRMYSKIAADARLPDLEQRRKAGLRLDRFAALAKLDTQMISLLFGVGIINGVNPSGEGSLPPLIVVAAVGVAAASAWIAMCWIAVAKARSNLGLVAEFTYPLCYIVAAAYMFASVFYGSRLTQIHGQAYLIVIPVLFLAARTCVWWDARLLSGTDVARQYHGGGVQQRDRRNPINKKNNNKGRPGADPADAGFVTRVPDDIVPLMHGAWLLKLPSIGSAGGGGSSPLKAALAGGGALGKGRWRYFQLSHDGSTLRWDWRKYVLLVHVESVECDTDNLTITLSLTLEPDLRLKFPNKEMHATWARGLTLLVMLLGNPDGLDGPASRKVPSLGRGADAPTRAPAHGEPGSPNRLLHRLASASARASAAGLLTKEALEAAAWQARKALEECSNPSSPADSTDGDVEQGHNAQATRMETEMGRGKNKENANEEDIHGLHEVEGKTEPGKRHAVFSLTANALGTQLSPYRPSTEGLRQRTPTLPAQPENELSASLGNLPGSYTPPNSGDARSRSRRVKNSATMPTRTPVAGTRSWVQRTLSAPADGLASHIQRALRGVSRQLTFRYGAAASTAADAASSVTTPPLGGLSRRRFAVDEEAPASVRSRGNFTGKESPLPVASLGPQTLEGNPPSLVQPRSAFFLPAIGSLGTAPSHSLGAFPSSHQPTRHHRSLSMGNETMPPVPEGQGGAGIAALKPSLPPVAKRTPLPGPALMLVGGSTFMFAGGSSSNSPASGGGTPPVGSAGGPSQPMPRAAQARGRGGSPLKNAGPPAGGHTQHRLMRYQSAPTSYYHRMAVGPDGSAAEGSGSASSEKGSGAAAGALLRNDSLGPMAAPGSSVWQLVFDAAIASHQGHTGGSMTSLEGSPSRSATPQSVHSIAHSMHLNVELIDYEALSFGKMLGEGGEGPVYAAWFRETPVAVKRASCAAEVDLHLHAGSHDNVVNLRGLAMRGGHTYLVMELCPRGTLDLLIHESSAPIAQQDPGKLLTIVRSVARGMLHLHTRSPPIMHRDLKPANVFIGHGWVMKVGDFGMARFAADTRALRAKQQSMGIVSGRFAGTSALQRTLTPGVIGTAAYCAPELLAQETPRASHAEDFDTSTLLKADVYSFGVLLYELLERKRPHADMEGFQIQTQWILDPESMRLPAIKIPERLPPAAARVFTVLAGLVEACTAWEPNDRPSFKEVLAVLRLASGGEATPARLTSPF